MVHMPFFRCGKGDSIVDNAGHGGIFAAVDEETGVIKTEGIDEKGNVYLKHPDSGTLFPGYQLPEWKSAISLVQECMHITRMKYVGWDLAHTKNGWVVVEGNHTGQFVGQMPLHKGAQKEIGKIVSQM